MASLLFIASDPFLAGIYGRKFERDGWDVEIAESFSQVGPIASRQKPDVVLLQDDAVDNPFEAITQLRAMPSLQASKFVYLASQSNRDNIAQARNAGANQYLILGHFVPHEAVEKIRLLLP